MPHPRGRARSPLEMLREVRESFTSSSRNNLEHVLRHSKFKHIVEVGHAIGEALHSEHHKGHKSEEIFGELGEELSGLVFGKKNLDVLHDVTRYAKGGAKSFLLSALLRQLGPVGRVVSDIIESGEPAAGESSSTIRRAIEALEEIGYSVTPPGKTKTRKLPAQPVTTPSRGTTGSGGQQLPVGSLPNDLGVVMYRVTSSNVYAIGYDQTTLTMRVQYLAPVLNYGGIKGRGHSGRNRVRGKLGKTVSKHKHGAGPTYDYHGVPLNVFKRIYSASSKGAAIWSNLRIRGTVWGHQYDYELVAAGRSIVANIPPGGAPWKRVGTVTYVPRKAVGPGAFKSRSIMQGKNTFKSLLPTVGLKKGKLSP